MHDIHAVILVSFADFKAGLESLPGVTVTVSHQNYGNRVEWRVGFITPKGNIPQLKFVTDGYDSSAPGSEYNDNLKLKFHSEVVFLCCDSLGVDNIPEVITYSNGYIPWVTVTNLGWVKLSSLGATGTWRLTYNNWTTPELPSTASAQGFPTISASH